MEETTYIGNELELFQHATVWKKYYADILKPYIKGNVLEAGAGIGSTTKYLCDGTQAKWLCLEPDPSLFDKLQNKIQAKALPSCCHAVKGVISDLQMAAEFDTILYIDVIEHIENDRQELQQAQELLAKEGSLIVLVPAHQTLYNSFDKAIGHFRRYNKRRLLSIAPGSLQRQKLIYLDSVGLFASMMNKYLLKQDYPTLKQINFWNKFMVPVSKALDRIVNYNLGKTLVGIWKKTK
jgi:SAM-dependent methyltransferase